MHGQTLSTRPFACEIYDVCKLHNLDDFVGSSRREEPGEDGMPYNSNDVFSEDDE